MKMTEKTAMSSHGAHQLALRCKSVNVLLGAMNVLTIRLPCDNGPGLGSGAMAGTGMAFIGPPGNSGEFYAGSRQNTRNVSEPFARPIPTNQPGADALAGRRRAPGST